jgi:hypothetical protein
VHPNRFHVRWIAIVEAVQVPSSVVPSELSSCRYRFSFGARRDKPKRKPRVVAALGQRITVAKRVLNADKLAITIEAGDIISPALDGVRSGLEG